MPITHLEAHQLIHRRADQGLQPTTQHTLEAHLAICADCTTYANEVSSTTTLLQSAMRKHWQKHPRTNNRMLIMTKWRSKKWQALTILPTRISVIASTLLLFIFGFWQFGLTSFASDDPLLATVSQIPTPTTAALADTQTAAHSCSVETYTVKAGETLTEIAQRYSLDPLTILTWNKFSSESVMEGQVLQLPLCMQTPTSTSHAPTTTLTPILQLQITTPG